MIVRFRNVPSCKECTQLINLEKVTNIAATEGPTPDDYRVHINFGGERILIRDKMSLQDCNHFLEVLQVLWHDAINTTYPVHDVNCAHHALNPVPVQEEGDLEWMEPAWVDPEDDEE